MRRTYNASLEAPPKPPHRAGKAVRAKRKEAKARAINDELAQYRLQLQLERHTESRSMSQQVHNMLTTRAEQLAERQRNANQINSPPCETASARREHHCRIGS